jgi:hypothetical protein
MEGGQHAKAKLPTVSVNGGVLQLAEALEGRDLVEVAFQTFSCPVHGMAEMLNLKNLRQRNAASISVRRTP